MDVTKDTKKLVFDFVLVPGVHLKSFKLFLAMINRMRKLARK